MIKKIISILKKFPKDNNNSKKLILDEISTKSYNDLKQLDVSVDSFDYTKIKNLRSLMDESEEVIKKMVIFYLKFNENSNILNFNEKQMNNEKVIEQLKNFPSFNLRNEQSIYEEIKKVNTRTEFNLQIEDSINVNLYFYYSNNDEKQIKFVKDNFKRISKIIFIFCNTFGINIKKLNNFSFRFLIIDFPRKLSTNNNFNFSELSDHGIFNNSSGYTNKITKEMVVSRKSGLTGLLIHELIHLLNLDFHFWRDQITNQSDFNWKKDWISSTNMLECSKKIKFNCGHYEFTEAICNTTSSYLLAIYSSIEVVLFGKNNFHIKLLSKIKKIFGLFYIIEYIHCYINSCKLLKFFGYDSYDSFFNNTNNRKYYQDSHVFEYIVLRTFIITYYYDIVFKRFLLHFKGNSFSDDQNYIYQKKVNNFIYNKMVKKDIKPFYDFVASNIKNLDSIEYFATNYIESE